jgi:phosphate uptake regulator
MEQTDKIVEHTNKRYEHELSALSTRLTQMGELVVAQIESALRSSPNTISAPLA